MTSSFPPGPGARVLVIQTAFLGDVVLVTPVFRALRAVYHGCHITACVTPVGAEVLRPCIGRDFGPDAIWIFDKRGDDSGISGVLRGRARMREEGFDVVIAPHRSVRTSLLVHATRATCRSGFDRNAWSLVYTHRTAYDPCTHETERNLSLVTALAEAPEKIDVSPALAVHPEADRTAAHLLHEAGYDGTAPLVVCAPGSRWGTKRWPPAYWAEALADIVTGGRYGVIVGTADDAAVADAILGAGSRALGNLTGRTSVAELVAVIARAAMVLTNDNGAMQIAAALKIPTVSVFGPTVPAQGFAPRHDAARVVDIDLACRPCSAHGPETCPLTHHNCMNDLTPAMVTAAARDVAVA